MLPHRVVAAVSSPFGRRARIVVMFWSSVPEGVMTFDLAPAERVGFTPVVLSEHAAERSSNAAVVGRNREERRME
jgi:hypothetical protein